MMREAIELGRTALGIELGSTRIKACLIDESGETLASGSSTWENQLTEGLWTYALQDVHTGLSSAYADLVSAVEQGYGIRPRTYGAIGVSAMMHGYLAFDSHGELLVPFRTWRNTNTVEAAEKLTAEFGHNIPLRWSIAHLYQAVLDGEPHVPEIGSMTTLAGYVHRLLTGEDVLGVGDASGMFPVDSGTADYDAGLLQRFEGLVASHGYALSLADLFPRVLTAGEQAGRLSAQGAATLDPGGVLEPGIPLCPPEGDAGTGMVATNAVRPRTGNVSVGTSIFAMVVLEGPLQQVFPEIDVVTTPGGQPVAMVHCNNGSSELGAWAGVFGEFAAALGHTAEPDAVFHAFLERALEPDAGHGELLSYNLLSGEPIAGVREGRPLLVRTPDSTLSLAGFARSQLFGVFASLSLGMRVLKEVGVSVDTVFAHGGLLRAESVAQRALAAAIGTSVAVGESAAEGGAWGIAALAAYARAVGNGAAEPSELAVWLDQLNLRRAEAQVYTPTEAEVAGYADYLDSWSAGLAVERTAIQVIR